MAALPKVNLTTNSTDKYIQITTLKDDGVTAVGDKYIFSPMTFPLDDLYDGWRFFNLDNYAQQYNLKFEQIVKLNGSAIGATTQAQVTALIIAALKS